MGFTSQANQGKGQSVPGVSNFIPRWERLNLGGSIFSNMSKDVPNSVVWPTLNLLALVIDGWE